MMIYDVQPGNAYRTIDCLNHTNKICDGYVGLILRVWGQLT